ncbi:MAG: flagellin [Oscillospiraceae bacterium]|nr:flagellin [Oscillospiraceae bacterium]
MSLVVQHNIPALNAYRQFTMNNSALAKNLEKLSSGFRINRAGDDAAGLAISEKMRAQIRGLETSQKNALDGISLIQTAEGALTEVHSMLNRMVELATQSSNGLYDEIDRKAMDDEFQQLKQEIDRISQATNFNGINLLDGSLGTGSTSAGAFKIGNDLSGFLKFGESNDLNPAVKSEYRVDSAHAATFVKSLATKVGYEGLDVENTSVSEIKSILEQALGFSLKDYDLGIGSDSSGKITDLTSMGAAGAIVLQARKGGIDQNVDPILLLAKNLSEGSGVSTVSAGGGFYQSVIGADAYRDMTIELGFNASDTNLIGKTFTVAGKTYQFAGQNDEVLAPDSDGAMVMSRLDGDMGGRKLENGNYAVDISGAYPTNISLANAMADAINNAEVYSRYGDAATPSDYINFTDPSTDTDPAVFYFAQGVDANVGTKESPVLVKLDLRNLGLVDALGQRSAGVGSSAGGLNLQIGDTADKYNILGVNIEDMSTKGLGIANLSVDTYDNAVKALGKKEAQGDIGTIKGAINTVSSQRATLGALQNRLEHTTNNIGVTVENLTAAESRIRDTDMAKEMMAYTKNSVLGQASIAMLAQANMLTQMALSIIR